MVHHSLEPLARGTLNAVFRTCFPNECLKKGSRICIDALHILIVMCKNPLALYLILGKRIGGSASGRIGDSVSVFSSMAALFAWQLPVFDRGKSHILKDARLRRNIFIFIGPWSARLPTGIGAARA